MNSGDSKNFDGDAQGGNMKGDRPDSSGGCHQEEILEQEEVIRLYLWKIKL